MSVLPSARSRITDFARVLLTAGICVVWQFAYAQATGQIPLPNAGEASADAWTIYLQGHEGQIRNDLQAAKKSLSRVIAMDENYFPAYMDRGIVYYKMQQYTLAAEDLSRAIDAGKPNPTLRFTYKLLGECYRKLDRPLDAVAVYSEYIGGAGSDDWEGIAERGEAYAHAKQSDAARQDYNRALKLSPGNPKVVELVTELDVQTADWTDALEDSTRLLGLKSGDAFATRVQTEARRQLSLKR